MRIGVISRYLIAAAAVAVLASPTDVSAQKYPERSQVRRGNRQYEQLSFDKAAEHYGQAVVLNDSCYEAKFNLGDAFYKSKEYDKAGEIFSALAADSTRSELERAQSFYNLGNTLFQQKKYNEALAAFKNSLRLNPADLEAKYNYAYTKKYVEDQQGGGGGGGQNNQNNQNDQQGGGDGGQDNQGQNGQDQNNQGQDNQDQNNQEGNDQNQNGQNDQNDQNRNGDDQQDDRNGDNQDNGDDRNDGDDQDDGQGDQDDRDNGNNGQNPPQPSGISEDDAQRMLDVVQGEEDNTRDKVNEKLGAGTVKSKKNW